MIRKSQGCLVLLMIFAWNLRAQAQYASGQWGAGLYGAMQPCGFGVSAGGGGISQSDEMEEIREQQKEIRERLVELKRKLNGKDGLNSEMRRREKEMSRYLKTGVVTDVKNHLQFDKTCASWTGMDDIPVTGPRKPEAQEKPKEELGPRIGVGIDTQVVPEKLTSIKASAWGGMCDIDGGNKSITSDRVCGTNATTVFDPKFLQPQDRVSCTNNLEAFQKIVRERNQTTAEIKQLEQESKNLQKAFKAATKQYAKDLKDGVYDDSTEGDYCVDCDFKRRQTYDRGPDWKYVGANLAMGLVGVYLGQRQTKMIAEYNSAQGFPTQNYASFGYGFPYIMNGIYGALGGGTGGGAFGCGAGIGGGGNWNGPNGMMGPYGSGGMYPGAGANAGLWGYPSGMWNPNGGGMFNSGMGPWGMNGLPYGMGAGMGGGMGMPAMMGGMGAAGYGVPAMMGGMGGGMGMPAMMGGGNYLGQMQMQMQMQQMQMQQQMQQQQMYMQQYNMYVQNEMRRQQTLQSLNLELNSLVMRIQQVQYGGSIGVGGNIGIGGSIGVGGNIGIGGSIGGGVNYNGNGNYLFGPNNSGGQSGCGVGLSCPPTTVPGGNTTPLGPTR